MLLGGNCETAASWYSTSKNNQQQRKRTNVQQYNKDKILGNKYMLIATTNDTASSSEQHQSGMGSLCNAGL